MHLADTTKPNVSPATCRRSAKWKGSRMKIFLIHSIFYFSGSASLSTPFSLPRSSLAWHAVLHADTRCDMCYFLLRSKTERKISGTTARCLLGHLTWHRLQRSASQCVLQVFVVQHHTVKVTQCTCYMPNHPITHPVDGTRNNRCTSCHFLSN